MEIASPRRRCQCLAGKLEELQCAGDQMTAASAVTGRCRCARSLPRLACGVAAGDGIDEEDWGCDRPHIEDACSA